MSAAGARHLNRVRSVPCVLCARLGMGDTPSAAHHPRSGTGMGTKRADWLAIALCHEHHQGDTGLHGMGRKAFEATYQVDEWDLLADTIEAIYGK